MSDEAKRRLVTLQKKITVKRDEAREAIKAASADDLSQDDRTVAREKAHALTKETTDLQADIEAQKALVHADDEVLGKIDDYTDEPAAKDRNEGLSPSFPEGSLGKSYAGSKAFKAWDRGSNGGVHRLNIGMKQLLQTSQGFEPRAPRTGEIVPFAHRPVEVLDMLPSLPTNQHEILFMEQTTRTAPAAADLALAEGAVRSEAAFEWTQRTESVIELGEYVPVTAIQYEDAIELTATIDMQLREQLREGIEFEIFNGPGTANRVTGFLNRTGRQERTAANVAEGRNNMLDTLLDSMADVMYTGWSSPNMIVMNGLDWIRICKIKDETGAYLWKNPNTAAGGGGGADMMSKEVFGVPVVIGNVLARNKAILLDTRFVTIRDRRDVTIRMGDRQAVTLTAAQIGGSSAVTVHTQPTGQMNVWGDVRFALQVRRAASIGDVTFAS